MTEVAKRFVVAKRNLRRGIVIALVALFVAPLLALLLEAWSWMGPLCLLTFLGSAFSFGLIRCPACEERFHGSRLGSLRFSCQKCGLPLESLLNGTPPEFPPPPGPSAARSVRKESK